jgi:hypothetical protein
LLGLGGPPIFGIKLFRASFMVHGKLRNLTSPSKSALAYNLAPSDGT